MIAIMKHKGIICGILAGRRFHLRAITHTTALLRKTGRS